MDILDCGHEPSPHSEHTTGYGTYNDDKTYCYTCCAKRDRKAMIETGRATLYLVKHSVNESVVNWPGSLSFPVRSIHIGHHNIAGKRYDVWFIGPDGSKWHGVTYGNHTQLCHCKRVKG